MPVITTVEPQQHDTERVNVYLDGTFAFGASLLLVSLHHLTVGRELSDQEVERIRLDDTVERALGAALNYLSFRPRSRREIRDYLRRKKTDDPVADAVLERLERLGLVDDREFARFWVENRLSFRPRGSRALRTEMRRKGLESEVIDEALSDIEDEEPLAYAAAQKKLRGLSGLEEREFFRKMVAYLQRRGFPYDTAARVARRIYAESEES